MSVADGFKKVVATISSPFTAMGINQATLSGAIDIIAVKQPDGSIRSSPFHVRFGKLQVMRTSEKEVTVYVQQAISDVYDDDDQAAAEAASASFAHASNSNTPPPESPSSPSASPSASKGSLSSPSSSSQQGRQEMTPGGSLSPGGSSTGDSSRKPPALDPVPDPDDSLLPGGIPSPHVLNSRKSMRRPQATSPASTGSRDSKPSSPLPDRDAATSPLSLSSDSGINGSATADDANLPPQPGKGFYPDKFIGRDNDSGMCWVKVPGMKLKLGQAGAAYFVHDGKELSSEPVSASNSPGSSTPVLSVTSPDGLDESLDGDALQPPLATSPTSLDYRAHSFDARDSTGPLSPDSEKSASLGTSRVTSPISDGSNRSRSWDWMWGHLPNRTPSTTTVPAPLDSTALPPPPGPDLVPETSSSPKAPDAPMFPSALDKSKLQSVPDPTATLNEAASLLASGKLNLPTPESNQDDDDAETEQYYSDDEDDKGSGGARSNYGTPRTHIDDSSAPDTPSKAALRRLNGVGIPVGAKDSPNLKSTTRRGSGLKSFLGDEGVGEDGKPTLNIPSNPSTPSTSTLTPLMSASSSRASLPKLSGSGPGWDLSLCASKLAPLAVENVDDVETAKTVFSEGTISHSEFVANPDLLYHPEAVLRYGDKYYLGTIALPLIVSQLIYGEPIGDTALAALWDDRQDHVWTKTKKRSPWSWFWRSNVHSDGTASAGASPNPLRKSIPRPPRKTIGGGDDAGPPPDPNLLKDHAPPSSSSSTSGETPASETASKATEVEPMLVPTSQQLAAMNLRPGENRVMFSVTSALGEQRLYAHVWMFESNARIVISDIDGTITRSDVLGNLLPAMGMDWSHPGVASLFRKIAANGYEILYLTARAIGQANVTKKFLKRLDQEGVNLPLGPVVMSPDRLFHSFKREVIQKKPEEFKIACLSTIRDLWPADHNPFYAGFGNRLTDAGSYMAVGVPGQRVLLIDPSSTTRLVSAHTPNSMTSYTSLEDVVDQVFPAVRDGFSEVDYADTNFWQVPLPSLEDLSSGSKSRPASEAGSRPGSKPVSPTLENGIEDRHASPASKVEEPELIVPIA